MQFVVLAISALGRPFTLELEMQYRTDHGGTTQCSQRRKQEDNLEIRN